MSVLNTPKFLTKKKLKFPKSNFLNPTSSFYIKLPKDPSSFLFHHSKILGSPGIFSLKKGPDKSEPEGECIISHVQKLAP